MTTQNKEIPKRELLTKKAFTRVMPQTTAHYSQPTTTVGEQPVTDEQIYYERIPQSDFIRQLDTNSHAINDRDIYKTYRQSGEDGLYYEEDFPRYAFPFQEEILNDRLARLTGNNIQFDLSERNENAEAWDVYNDIIAGWSDKGMERAWYFLAKSVLSTGDGAFVGLLVGGKLRWRVFSFANGDILYPHYDRRTGELSVFAREYSEIDNDGNYSKYVDVWDDTYYYRLTTKWDDGEKEQEDAVIGEFAAHGYTIEEKIRHGFNEVPISYKRDDGGACWSNVQETIEHYEAAFSRLAQNNHDFGLPIMYLKGQGKQIHEIATSDMSYASKIFIIPSDGDAGFLQRQDASGAYKTELDELRKKIYEGASVVKAPELKSGDTPAAAIKLLYSDSYNKALLETQEYDEPLMKMIGIFKWGYGVEKERRLDYINTHITAYAIPYIPINDNEATTILATAVQNGFCSRQTASERFYYSTPREWERILQEKHDEKARELLVEEQRLDMQQENAIETQEVLSEIQTEQQIEIINAQENAEDGEEEKAVPKVSQRKGNVRTGRRPGRPVTVGTDKWGNRVGENNWNRTPKFGQ